MNALKLKSLATAAALTLAGAASAQQTFNLTNADGTLEGSVSFEALATSGLKITITNLTAKTTDVGAGQELTGVVFKASSGVLGGAVSCAPGSCDAKETLSGEITESTADGFAWAWSPFRAVDPLFGSTGFSYLSSLPGEVGLQGQGEGGPDYGLISAAAKTFGSSLLVGSHNPLYVGSVAFLVGAGTDFSGVAFSDVQFRFNTDGLTVAAIPEPSTYALMAAGLAAVGFVARRRRPIAAV